MVANSRFISIACMMLVASATFDSRADACTTLVASGRATVDGRPLLWKNRDYWQRHNELIHDDSGRYPFVGITNAGAVRNIRMGVNSAGLCIENSTSRDLAGDATSGPLNGELIRMGLESCATVEEFEELLKTTNSTGRRTRGNFGVIDAHGGAMMFEVGPRFYRAFNANDPEDAPLGFIVRSNFSETAREQKAEEDRALESLYSSERYLRAFHLCEARLKTSKLDLEFVLHEVCRDIDGPSACDFGCETDGADGNQATLFKTSSTLNRNMTVSAVVFKGVKPGESPTGTTMWSILGEPMFSVAVPAWASQGKVSELVDGPVTSSLCDLSLQLRDANYDPKGRQILTAKLPEITRQIKDLEQKLIDQSRRAAPTSSTDLFERHDEAVESARQLLNKLVLTYAADRPAESADAHKRPPVDFQFNDSDGTKLAETIDSSGDARWDGGMTDSTVVEGSFRIRRNKTEPVTRHLNMVPKIRTRYNDARDPKVDKGWLVVEIAGWDFRGATPNEFVRFGFSSQPEKSIHTVGLVIERTKKDVVSVSGIAFGDGGTNIPSTHSWPAAQLEPVTFVLELDKARGNPDEGDTGGLYRIFFRKAEDKRFTQLGAQGQVRRLRNGNAIHFRTAGYLGFDDEYFDVDRIYFTAVNPGVE